MPDKTHPFDRLSMTLSEAEAHDLDRLFCKCCYPKLHREPSTGGGKP